MEAKETDRVENLTNRDMQKVFMSLDKLIAKREAKATKAPTYQEASTQPLSEEEMDRGENIMGKHLDEFARRVDERVAERKMGAKAKATTYQKAKPRELSQEELDSMDNITDHHMMELVQAMKERREKREAEAKKGQ